MTLSMCNISKLTLCICNMSNLNLCMCNMHRVNPNPLAYQSQVGNLTSFTCSRQVPCLTCLWKWKSKWVGEPDQMRSSMPDLGRKTKKVKDGTCPTSAP